MNEKDERLIASFFEQNKQPELPDDGFSDAVMERLPRRSYDWRQWLYPVWTVGCSLAAVALFFILGAPSVFANVFADMTGNFLGEIASAATSETSVLTVLSVVVLFAVLAVRELFVAIKDRQMRF